MAVESRRKAGRPREHFLEQDRHIWEPKVRELAALNLRDADIAHAFGISAPHLTIYDEVMEIIREEKAAYRFRIEKAFYTQAMYSDAEIMALAEDREHRAEMRQTRAKFLMKIFDYLNRDPIASPKEQERIRRLSDEDLLKEIQKELAS